MILQTIKAQRKHNNNNVNFIKNMPFTKQFCYVIDLEFLIKLDTYCLRQIRQSRYITNKKIAGYSVY